MAKSPRRAAALNVAYKPVSDAIAAIGVADATGHASILNAKQTMLAAIIAAVRGVKPVTAETWKAEWSEGMRKMLADAKGPDGSARYASAATISVTLSGFRNCVLALSHVPPGANEHALLPTSAETSFDLYWRGVRPRLSAAGILEAVQPRTPTVSKADKIKALAEQNAALAEKLKAANATVSDKAQAPAKQTDDAKAASDLLAKQSAVDVMVATARAVNANCSPTDAQIILTAFRKNFTMAMQFLKAVADGAPA